MILCVKTGQITSDVSTYWDKDIPVTRIFLKPEFPLKL